LPSEKSLPTQFGISLCSGFRLISDVLKMDLTKPSIPLIIIYSGTTIGSIGGGYLSSLLIKKAGPSEEREVLQCCCLP
jgi:1,4-dihydroxy-2-naphthoyl-CoA synthase